MLLHGDCLERMKEIQNNSVDMVLCDLPYGTTACKWDTMIPFEPLWAQYKRVIKPNGAIVLFGSQPFTSALVMSNPKWLKCNWVWEKHQGTNPICSKYQPMKCHEDILIFAKGTTTYNPIMTQGVSYGGFEGTKPTGKVHGKGTRSSHRNNSSGNRFPRSVQYFKGDRGLHPTQKPVALMEYLIRTYTNAGEMVLDNTMGSGTTGVACVNTGRNFIGIERDEAYFNIASNRIQFIKENKYETKTIQGGY
jgi:site-specific DNA-methyltransferase (adenine-specific)